jgi:hypothetical protein
MTVTNPYQDVIDWLRTSEGEAWSENRMALAKAIYSSGQLTLNAYGDGTIVIWKGLFSIKRDDDPRHRAEFIHPRVRS